MAAASVTELQEPVHHTEPYTVDFYSHNAFWCGPPVAGRGMKQCTKRGIRCSFAVVLGVVGAIGYFAMGPPSGKHAATSSERTPVRHVAAFRPAVRVPFPFTQSKRISKASGTRPTQAQRMVATIQAPVLGQATEALQHIHLQLPTNPDDKAWHQAFEGLVKDEAFVSKGWAQRPFKLKQEWKFAVGTYTIDQVQRDVQLLPPQFVAHGVRWGDGIYNKAMQAGFTYGDVQKQMMGATVVMLNAGFVVPALASVALAALDATSLPIWLNVYLTRPGLSSSTQLHTDKQDVILVQTSGKKRWRVYSPPPPAKEPHLDPFARGKGEDLMVPDPGDLLLDTVMEPGQVLYIPAGFPHETDTLDKDANGGFAHMAPIESSPPQQESNREPSVHLTIGVDTHLWGLSWAKMRELVLRRANVPCTLASGLPVNTLSPEHWMLLHSPLPLGFASLQLLSSATEDVLAEELALRMFMAEPERWPDTAAVSAELPLHEAVALFKSHYVRVLTLQRSMYKRAADGKMQQKMLNGDMGALDDAMQSLEAWANGKDVVIKQGFASNNIAKKSNKKKQTKAKGRR